MNTLNSTTSEGFSNRVVAWFKLHGRKHLPWQQQVTAYRVWLSEIMLQQTQVNTVIPYYEKFLSSFPTLESLAQASADNVLAHWSGLGYYARARNLHKTAQIISTQYQQKFPDNIEQLIELPGIGLSTAGAILSLAMKQSHAILDGNVKRVLARHFEVDGWPGKSSVLKQLWQLSKQLTPQQNTAFYNQAMMDIGATICTRTQPKCADCCLNDTCLAFKNHTWANYPNSKPKKKNPQKQAYLVLLKQAQGVYLEKRPNSGIWGGLWSFPEFASAELATDWIQQQSHSFQANNVKLLENEKLHKFSHYDFLMHIVSYQNNQPKAQINDSQFIFIKADEINNTALPTPIKALLKTHGFKN